MDLLLGAVHLAEGVIVHRTIPEAVKVVRVVLGVDVGGGVTEILVIFRQYHGGVEVRSNLKIIVEQIES